MKYVSDMIWHLSVLLMKHYIWMPMGDESSNRKIKIMKNPKFQIGKNAGHEIILQVGIDLWNIPWTPIRKTGFIFPTDFRWILSGFFRSEIHSFIHHFELFSATRSSCIWMIISATPHLLHIDFVQCRRSNRRSKAWLVHKGLSLMPEVASEAALDQGLGRLVVAFSMPEVIMDTVEKSRTAARSGDEPSMLWIGKSQHLVR